MRVAPEPHPALEHRRGGARFADDTISHGRAGGSTLEFHPARRHARSARHDRNSNRLQRSENFLGTVRRAATRFIKKSNHLRCKMDCVGQGHQRRAHRHDHQTLQQCFLPRFLSGSAICRFQSLRRVSLECVPFRNEHAARQCLHQRGVQGGGRADQQLLSPVPHGWLRIKFRFYFHQPQRCFFLLDQPRERAMRELPRLRPPTTPPTKTIRSTVRAWTSRRKFAAVVTTRFSFRLSTSGAAAAMRRWWRT